MSRVLPAVLAVDTESYNKQIKSYCQFTNQLHIDISDGIFSPTKTVGINDVWWPAGVRVSMHVMYKKPSEIIDKLLYLKPELVILHAEAEGDFLAVAEKLHSRGIRAGVALLPKTKVDYVRPGLGLIDHITIFSGDLGSYGGSVDMSLLDKVSDIKELDSNIEIGWDGGVTADNIQEISSAGIEAIVSGGYIANSENPRMTYKHLRSLVA